MGVSASVRKYLSDGYSVIRLFDYGLGCSLLKQLAAESGERREVLASRAGARWLTLLAIVISNQYSVKKGGWCRLCSLTLVAGATRSGERRA